MTEVQEARTHLRKCQEHLFNTRKTIGFCIGGQREIRKQEPAVLAALSWVWDAQERAGLNRQRRGIYLTPPMQEVALLRFPKMEGEPVEQWRNRAFTKYAYNLAEIRLT